MASYIVPSFTLDFAWVPDTLKPSAVAASPPDLHPQHFSWSEGQLVQSYHPSSMFPLPLFVTASHPNCKATSVVFAWCQMTAHKSFTCYPFALLPCLPSLHFPVVGFCPEITFYHRMSLNLWWSLFFSFAFLELVCLHCHPSSLGMADNSIM